MENEVKFYIQGFVDCKTKQHGIRTIIGQLLLGNGVELMAERIIPDNGGEFLDFNGIEEWKEQAKKEIIEELNGKKI